LRRVEGREGMGGGGMVVIKREITGSLRFDEGHRLYFELH